MKEKIKELLRTDFAERFTQTIKDCIKALFEEDIDNEEKKEKFDNVIEAFLVEEFKRIDIPKVPSWLEVPIDKIVENVIGGIISPFTQVFFNLAVDDEIPKIKKAQQENSKE